MRNPVRLSLATVVALLAAPALGASASAPAARRPAGKGAAATGSLQRSSQLWATINVCNPYDQPDMIGIRGSMPGDGHSNETMYMLFRLQYENSSKRFVDLASDKAQRWRAVGSAKSARQDGRSFQLVPVPGRPAFVLRGVVSFQWRRGSTVIESASRPTTAGHRSLAGADPAGFSAATCSIG